MTGPILDATSKAAQDRWGPIALEARKRKLAIEIRDGTSDAPYRLAGKERSGADWDGGAYPSLGAAFDAAESWVLEHPLPGPVALRAELQEHGRRLALLQPRDLGAKNTVPPIYKRFRDRILPLAFDNLVDATRLENLEDGARSLLESLRGSELVSAASSDTKAAIGTLAGLVPPKEGDDPWLPTEVTAAPASADTTDDSEPSEKPTEAAPAGAARAGSRSASTTSRTSARKRRSTSSADASSTET